MLRFLAPTIVQREPLEPHVIGEDQVAIASSIVEKFAKDRETNQSHNVALILDNLSFFTRNVDTSALPGRLPQKWERLMERFRIMAVVAIPNWHPVDLDATDLERIRDTVEKNKVVSYHLRSLSKTIIFASMLFCESLPHSGGNMEYYRNNLTAINESLALGQEQQTHV